MFERFTERARRVLFFARYEASQLGSRTMETDHVLLGLIREPRGQVRRIFLDLNVPLDDFRRQIEHRRATGSKVATSVEIPFSAAAKRALGFAAEEADSARHNYIGPEHLLAGVLRDDQSPTVAELAARGVTLRYVRDVLASPDPADGTLPAAERHDADVQRVALKARIAAATTRSPLVETSDILGAMFELASDRLERLFVSPEIVAIMRDRLTAATQLRERMVAEAGGVGWSAEVVAVFVAVAAEADALGEWNIGPGHILLGLLARERTVAAAVLRDAGLTAGVMRTRLGTP